MASHTHTLQSLAGLSINDVTEPVAEYPSCYPSINPVDRYRIHIAELIAKTLNLDPKNVYPRVQWTNTLDKGDLVIA
ncbi:Arginyl-tRNA synthetase, partial [Ascosphaera atra]